MTHKQQLKRYPDFEPKPFYFFNDKFNAEEIISQLDCMKENGILSFFLHVRDGKTIEEAYGTDIYFEQVRFIVKNAAKRGIKVWLYDEDSYPSGNCGGKIVMDYPELQARTLRVEKVEVKSGIARKELGRVKGLFGYVVKTDNGKETVRVVKNCFGPIRKRWYQTEVDKFYISGMEDLHYIHRRGETDYATMSFELRAEDGDDVYVAYIEQVNTDERYGTQVDTLNPRTADLFIKYVHENYKKFVGNYFGNEIPGIFFDEPWTGGKYIAYTDCLHEYFYKKFGYRIDDCLYKLCSDYNGEYKQFGKDYLIACKTLFTDNFIKPIKKWCRKNKLLLTGHFQGEENPVMQAFVGQDIFDNCCETDIPGFDVITTNLGGRKYPQLLLGANIVSTVAAWTGKKTVLSECMALSPFNMNYYGEKRIADWLFANGINLLVLHAFYYGYSAFQRSEAGKSFFFQDENFCDYRKFAGYAGRVCKILHEYRRQNDILLVIPISCIRENVFHSSKDNTCARIYESIISFVRAAAENQTGFDVVYSDKISKCTIINGKLRVADCEYDKVYMVNGGKDEDDIYKRLSAKGVDVIMFNETQNFDFTPKYTAERAIDLIAYEKIDDRSKLIFLFNNCDEYKKYKIQLKDYAYVYDAETDEKKRLKTDEGYAEICMQAYDSVIVLTFDTEQSASSEYKIEPPATQERHEYLKNPQIFYKPKGAKGVICSYNLEILAGGVKTCYENVKNKRLRDVYGTQNKIYRDRYVIPYYDNAPQIPDIYPVKAIYSAKVKLNDGDFLLFDGGTISGNYKLKWNGNKIDESEFEKKRIYDMSNFIFRPEEVKKENVFEIVFENADEFDGVNGEIYIM